MAKGGNKFARMLQGNGQKMTVILVYTILEWILISLLLLNALFSYLITRFALYFGLKPPCLLCSRVDDLFHPPTGLSLFPDLICENHVVEISSLAFDCEGEKEDDDLVVEEQPRSFDDLVPTDSSLKEEPIGEKPRGRGEREEKDSGDEEAVVAREREADDLVIPDSTTAPENNGSNVDEEGDLTRVQGSEEDEKTDGEISIGSEICDREHVQPSHMETIQSASEEEIKAQTEGSREPSVERASSAASDHSVSNSRSILRAQSADLQDDLLEGEERIDGPRFEDSSHASKTDRSDYGSESVDDSVTSEMESPESLTMDQLKDELQTARKSLRSLYAELEEERSAAAVAANQTMAMITRLQEERSTMLMEVSQYRRMIEEQIHMEGPQYLDEQSEYENEELQMLTDLVITRENEKAELENELEIYRAKVLRYETEGRMNGSNANGMVGIIDEDVDLGKDEQLLDQAEDQYAAVGNALSPKTDDNRKAQTNDAEKLLENFENDRLAILEQLKSLEKRISSVKRVEKSEDQNPRDKDPDEAGESHNETSDASIPAGGDASEMKKVSNGSTDLPHSVATAENGEGKLERQETASSDDSDFPLDLDERPFTIEEEVEELYRKIQDLEDDREFIKLTIRFLKNGDRCMNLLQEILEQLQNVRTAEATVGNESSILIEATA